MDSSNVYIFVFQVPEIIGSIRQAGKLARQEEIHSHLCDGDDAFSKKFEVLFCGRVIVAHKKAPPALIDECIDKFKHVSCTKKKDTDCTSPQTTLAVDISTGISFGEKLRSVFQSTFTDEEKQKPMRKSYSQPGLRTNHSFHRDWKDGPCSLPGSFEDSDNGLDLQKLNEEWNCVQPTDMKENQTMLFTVCMKRLFFIQKLGVPSTHEYPSECSSICLMRRTRINLFI